MKWVRLSLPALLLLGAGTTLLFAQAALREFRPPRTAVVDISDIFDQYEKKKVVEGNLKANVEKAEKEFEAMKKEIDRIEAELKIVQEGSEEHRNLVVRRTDLQFKMRDFQKTTLNNLRSQELDALRVIRDEIVREIERYAKGRELDLVIEKKIAAGNRGENPINWPIVHFSRPEIDITAEIIAILNAQYKGAGGG